MIIVLAIHGSGMKRRYRFVKHHRLTSDAKYSVIIFVKANSKAKVSTLSELSTPSRTLVFDNPTRC